MSEVLLQVVHEPDAIACVTDPVRREILKALQQEGSASSISSELKQPRQKLAYHIRKLEQAGLLKHIRDQRKGNCTERILQATAKRYLIAPNAASGDLSPEELQDRLSANSLLALAAGCIDDLCEVQEIAGDKRVSTLSLQVEVGFSKQAEKAAFAEAITQAVSDIASRYPLRDSGRQQRFNLILGAYPKVGLQAETELETNHE